MSNEQLQQLISLAERFVISFERIAAALDGLDGTYKKRFGKEYPEREVRDAIVSRVPNQEDKIREAHGASDKPINDWITEDPNDEEDFGVRERDWLQRNAGAKTADGASS